MPLYQKLGQTISSAVGVATWSTTAGQYGDLTSISVTAGTWSIAGATSWVSAGITATAYVGTGISTTSGNSGTGLVSGDTIFFQQKSTPSDSRQSIAVPSVIVTLTATTTYYLKCIADTSITNLQVGGRITATRIA